MRTIHALAISVAVLLFGSLALAAEGSEETPAPAPPEETPDVMTIVERANLAMYYPGNDGRARVHMMIKDKQGNVRQREFNILRRDVKDGGDQMYFVYFFEPADVRKMVYLVHKHAAVDKDDDRWLYLPSLDLVKRIAASDKRTSFVGSDFLYEDVSGRSPQLDNHELVTTTDAYYLIKSTPKRPEQVEFAYYHFYVDRRTWLPYKIEYFDKEGKLLRTIEALKIEMIEKLPTITHSRVRDAIRESTTEMTYSGVDYNIDVGDIFQERYLRRPPRSVMQ